LEIDVFFLFPTRNIILTQGISALLMIVAAGVYFGVFSGMSVGIGCMVAWIPFLVLHAIFFRNQGKQLPHQTVKQFYWAIILKFLALIILFTGAMQWQALEAKKFFFAFIVMQISCWGGYLLLLRNGKIQ
jgi:F0F1-type ATP synthase assembly protein I